MSELNDIWQDGKGKLPEEKLMAYLEGRLSPEEQHEVELWLADEGMESDAVDGLKDMEASEAKETTDRLNHQLRKQLMPKKRKRRQMKDNPWAVQAVVIILLLVILAYIIIRLAVKK
jgi:anti-sigma factor RsiW